MQRTFSSPTSGLVADGPPPPPPPPPPPSCSTQPHPPPPPRPPQSRSLALQHQNHHQVYLDRRQSRFRPRYPADVRREPFHATPPDTSVEQRGPLTRESRMEPELSHQRPSIFPSYHHQHDTTDYRPLDRPPPTMADLPPPSEPSSVPGDPFFWQLPSNFEAKMLAPAPKPRKTCLVCMDVLDEDQFPYKCTICSAYSFCRDCLRSWFLDACKNESKMPPKCCTAIPVSCVAGVLTKDQMDLFKAKYEEWSTPDRLYCPVNRCSRFVPARLYIKPSVTGKVKDNHVSCPGCGITICTGCHASAHLGACTESNLDPALEEKLKSWKIKRCPRCKTGVKKVFGCSHVECRCGAHFCWECLLPISQCDGRCVDDSEDEASESELAEDDLDGRAGFNEDGEHDFGPEPYGPVIDEWNCHHIWTPSETNSPDRRECQICYREIRSLGFSSSETDRDGDTPMSDGDYWQCAGAHVICPACPRVRMVETFDSVPAYTYSCPCGSSYCPACKWAERMKELQVAYECRCGMRVCGACKDHTQN